MTGQDGLERLTAIEAAFQRLSTNGSGLTVTPRARADGELDGKEFVVEMLFDGGPKVVLVVGVAKADVTARSGRQELHAGEAMIHDRLAVDLTTCYRWDDAVRSDA